MDARNQIDTLRTVARALRAPIDQLGGGTLGVTLPLAGDRYILVTTHAGDGSECQAGYYEPERDDAVRWTEGGVAAVLADVNRWRAETR